MADFPADSRRQDISRFLSGPEGTRGHLRLIREGYSKILLLLQIEVRRHEVQQLLGQKLGLQKEQHGKRVRDQAASPKTCNFRCT